MRQVEKIHDNLIYVTDKSFEFGLDDEKSRQFGILFEITDMDEATGEKEFKNYPFIVSASIVADKCHKSFDESGDAKPTKFSLIYDAHSYMGGVPIDHILTHSIKPASVVGDAFEALAGQFTAKQAMVKTNKLEFGTAAAQLGRGVELDYLQFKTFEDAERFVNLLIETRLDAISIMIGFILDRPINLMGESGWSVIKKMVKGAKGGLR